MKSEESPLILVRTKWRFTCRTPVSRYCGSRGGTTRGKKPTSELGVSISAKRSGGRRERDEEVGLMLHPARGGGDRSTSIGIAIKSGLPAPAALPGAASFRLAAVLIRPQMTDASPCLSPGALLVANTRHNEESLRRRTRRRDRYLRLGKKRPETGDRTTQQPPSSLCAERTLRY